LAPTIYQERIRCHLGSVLALLIPCVCHPSGIMNRLLLASLHSVVTSGVIIKEQADIGDFPADFDGGQPFMLDGEVIIPRMVIVDESGGREPPASHRSQWGNEPPSVLEGPPSVAAGGSPSLTGGKASSKGSAGGKGEAEGGEAASMASALSAMLGGGGGGGRMVVMGPDGPIPLGEAGGAEAVPVGEAEGEERNAEEAEDGEGGKGKEGGKGMQIEVVKGGGGKGQDGGKGSGGMMVMPMGGMMGPGGGGMGGPMNQEALMRMLMGARKPPTAEEKAEMEKDKLEISAVTEAELEKDDEEEAKQKKEMAEGGATPNPDAHKSDDEELRPKLAIIAEKELASGKMSQLSKGEAKRKEDKGKAENKDKKTDFGEEDTTGKKDKMDKILLDHKLDV